MSAQPHVGADEYTGDKSIRGVKAAIDVKRADLCTPSGSGNSSSSVWVMIESSNGAYIQVGYNIVGTGAGSELTYFWEWRDIDGTIADQAWSGASYGTIVTFKIQREGDGHFHVYVDGQEGPADSHGNASSSPFRLVDLPDTSALWDGEVLGQGSDVPGTVNNKTDIDTMRTLSLADNWVVPASYSPDNSCSYFHVTSISADRIKIWTDPVNHGSGC